MSKVLDVAQYYSQLDSATRHSMRMCFSSSCAMAIKFLKPEALLGSNADDDYLRTVLKYGDTTIAGAQVKACADYGIEATYRQNGKFSDLFKEIDAGFPVATGILHKGPVTRPRGGGHWMLMIGYTATHGIFHDPYGELDNVNGDYVRVGDGGKAVQYSLKNWGRRWMVEGPGSGWYLSFRRKDAGDS
jgi:Peptidase_C39 like family